MEGRGTCFFLRVRCQIRQHIFSSLELRSRVFRVATTFSHVRWRSDSSTPLTTSSTKYFVGLKWPLSVKFAAAAGFCSSIAVAPVSNIASKYPFIHSFPAIFPLAKLGTNEESEAISNSNYQTPLQAATNWICRVFSFFFHTIVIHRVLELKLFFFSFFCRVCGRNAMGLKRRERHVAVVTAEVERCGWRGWVVRVSPFSRLSVSPCELPVFGFFILILYFFTFTFSNFSYFLFNPKIIWIFYLNIAI